MPSIRPYRPTDLDALYEICLRTGAAGEDASAMVSEPRLFGDLWAAPYAVLEPEHALILDDDHGRAVGYVLGALDTRAFEARCATEWWPAAQTRHPVVAGAEGLDALLVHVIHHPRRADGAVVARYPSHLHIDLLPEAQGAGWGRRMMEALFALIAAAGSSGVHWGVNHENRLALGFYRHLGASELSDGPMTHRFGWPL